MGRKGAKLTEAATLASEQLEQLLGPVGDISRKKMFGGYGVFESGVMFALVTSEAGVFFKVSDSNRQDYESSGSVKYGRMPYYSVPPDVLNREATLRQWARVAIQVSREALSRRK